MTPKVKIEVQADNQASLTTQGGDKTPLDPKLNENSSRFESDLDKANFISKLIFTYGFRGLYNTFIDRKTKTKPDEDLVLTIPWKDRPDVISDRVTWNLEKRKREKPHKAINVALAVFKASFIPFLFTIIGMTIFVSAKLFSAWVLKKLVQAYIDQDTDEAYYWSIVISAVLVVGFVSEHYWNFLATYFPAFLRNACVDLIYGKITRLSSHSLIKLSQGKLINLASNSLTFLENYGLYFPSLIVGIYSVIVGGVIVWQSFGVSTLVGLGYIVCWWPIQALGIAASLKTRDATDELTNQRVKVTRETVEGIRLFKMYTWEMRFKAVIEELRKQEVEFLKGAAIGQASGRAIGFSVQNCGTFLMFLTYVYGQGKTLEVADTFAAYFVFGYLRIFASFLVGGGLVFFSEAKICFNNMEQVLDAQEIGEVEFEEPENKENAIEYKNFTAYWALDDAKENLKTESQNLVHNEVKPTLHDVNLKIKKGSLNALVGTVGAGKTSFLMSFTGEMPKTTGSLKYKGSIAYVEQEPTIFAGTLKSNVIFGRPYDEERYQSVVHACCLISDIRLFAKGDEAEVVEGGNNLSGGQKARLALARAVYADADIYLLDDPLSAVDPKVARSLYKNVIDGVLKGKTIILVTHQVDFVRTCENIIVMETGRVLGSGTLESLSQQGVHAEYIFGDRPLNSNDVSKASVDDKQIHHPHHHEGPGLVRVLSENREELVHKLEAQIPKKKENKKEEEKEHDAPEPMTQEEKDSINPERYVGNVTLLTYVGLFKEMGGIPMTIALIVTIVASQMTTIAYGRILGAWIGGTFAQWKTVSIMGGLVGFDLFIFNTVFVLIGLASVAAGKNYHQKILDKVIRAKVLFFDTNPVGGVVDRFATDIGVLDRFIPLALTDVLNIVAFLISILITIGIIQPLLLAPLLGACVLAAFIFYLTYPGIERFKLYEMRSKGPVYDLFSATLNGVAIIRIYKQVDTFKKRFREVLHKTTKGGFSNILAFRIAGFYADFTYTAAVIGCIFILTAKSSGSVDTAYLSAFGLSLILGITGLFQHGLRQMSALNISMASVARVQEFLKIPEEPQLKAPGDDEHIKNNWPQKGEIDLNKVYMKYRPDAGYVIKDLNIEIKPGEKIGCVGRTGAGKSTIVQLLYRMREISKKGKGSPDSYIKMDGVDTSSLGLHTLRSNISMIPQTPYIFSGTVRTNVDPLNQFSDKEIWDVLEDVRLKEHIEKQPQKLETVISSGSAIFSVGQKQLVCLARAVLKPSKVLILDEATANMDHETDNFLQEKIGQRFANSTRITIAHRLTTIASYDKVLVLSKGKKIEYDEPYKLLVKNIGDEELTNLDGHFSIMVQNTGPISSQQIFDIARESYFEKHKL